MTQVVTDISPWIAYFQGETCLLLEMAMKAGSVRIPALVKLEILANILSDKDRKSLEEILDGFTCVELSTVHLRRAAKMKAMLQRKGVKVSVRDAHILQSALDENAVLISSDPLFHQIQDSSGVKVQMW